MATITGTAGNDPALGSNSNDMPWGGANADTLFGAAGCGQAQRQPRR